MSEERVDYVTRAPPAPPEREYHASRAGALPL